MSKIKIRGAREHNLKNVSLDIPKNKLVVITGISGSGKSTLAFDTLYAEGQRRYVESLSSYARQFLNLMPKPDVDRIDGLSPSISIEQKTISKNPRSTVGTITEIYDYLRLLYARVGVPHSPATGLPIKAQTSSQIIDEILKIKNGTKIYILAPIAQQKKGEFKMELSTARRNGFEKAFIDGTLSDLNDIVALAKTKKHDILLVIDRVSTSPDPELRQRVANSVEIALSNGGGVLIVKDFETGEERLFSEKFACPVSGFCIPEIAPKLFSFNSPYGACKKCGGVGFVESWGVITASPFKGLMGLWDAEETDENEVVFGCPTRSVDKDPCSECKGARLCKEALAVKIDGKNIAEVSDMSIEDAANWFGDMYERLTSKEKSISEKIVTEIKNRLGFLMNVGLQYLALSRPSETLSGGEAQRIRLASQIGSGLSGVLYVLDEPSIGLHQKDNQKLIDTLKKLKENENTVIVVEHDDETMKAADWIIDMGPRAGEHGGEVMAAGTVEQVISNENSLTGKYLSGELFIPVPKRRKQINLHRCIEIVGATANNLKNVSVKFPLGALTCVTGVSGSGKSTLVIDTLFKAAYNKISAHKKANILNVESIRGLDLIDKVVDIDQSPIGRTPRSNPATYIGCFTDIRNLFASMPEARARGYTSSRFSFNVKGGRCDACKGDGVTKVEMHFLPDVYVMCDQCNGKRYNRETLEVKFRGKSIADVLDMTIDEGADLFKNQQSIYQKLEYLCRVGLGYLTIGHKATILSGGEAQRVKLSKELSKRSTGNTLYILDEPTTGLHMDDIKKLLEILQIFVEHGNTIIIIEHNLDVIKTADWIIDIGRDGGDRGGEVVAVGTPEEIAMCERSYTGQYLKKMGL
ncbi:MAG: excinuclease ABC subunit UvrA [Holosporales bacterium]|jgi:excinuclease ABC subunit A|nr:excinuclease ABC subunit UvrA [Holosporales bacterium]